MPVALAATPPLDRLAAQGASRGTVLVLPGRGDDPSYYRRLAARLAVDGYVTDVAQSPTGSDDVVAAWHAQGDVAGLRVVIAVDTSAGFAATALSDGRLDPAGAVFAGIVDPEVEAPAIDELDARSACPVYRRLAADVDAGSLSASSIRPVWPQVPAPLPVLALHGGADAIAPEDRSALLLDGWNAERVVVKGGRHDVLNDVHHRVVAGEVVSFLERLRVDPTGAPLVVRTSVSPVGALRKV